MDRLVTRSHLNFSAYRLDENLARRPRGEKKNKEEIKISTKYQYRNIELNIHIYIYNVTIDLIR